MRNLLEEFVHFLIQDLTLLYVEKGDHVKVKVVSLVIDGNVETVFFDTDVEV